MDPISYTIPTELWTSSTYPYLPTHCGGFISESSVNIWHARLRHPNVNVLSHIFQSMNITFHPISNTFHDSYMYRNIINCHFPRIKSLSLSH